VNERPVEERRGASLHPCMAKTRSRLMPLHEAVRSPPPAGDTGIARQAVKEGFPRTPGRGSPE
jgi:hypothetical protein